MTTKHRRPGLTLTAIIELEVEVSDPDYPGQVDPGSRAKAGDYRGQVGPGSRSKKTHKRKIKVRIFSLRGLNRLGIYARTEVGNEFHTWILDMIEGKSSTRTLMNDHVRLLRYFFERRPRWKVIHTMFMSHVYSFEEIGLRVGVKPVSAQRAVQKMCQRGVISERDYENGKADAREMVGYWRDTRQLKLDL